MTGLAALTLSALAFQLLIGAFTAGLRAGHVANDWPLMQGRLFPAGVDWSQGIVNALSYDPYLIYFVHRWWAFAVVILLVVVARQLKAMGFKTLSKAIHAMFGIQILLGIATVLSGIAIWLAALHQLAGALLVIATVRGAHAIGTQK